MQAATAEALLSAYRVRVHTPSAAVSGAWQSPPQPGGSWHWGSMLSTAVGSCAAATSVKGLRSWLAQLCAQK